MSRQVTKRQILRLATVFIIAISPALLGIKWALYWGQWVYFPTWPNILDLLLLLTSSALLLYYIAKEGMP